MCLQGILSRLATHFYGDLVHWRSRIANVPVFSSCPKRPYEWRVHSHGCYKFDNALLGLGPRDKSPSVLHLRNTNLPGPSSIMRSDKLNKEDLSADMTKNVCRDDVHQENAHDCAPFLQGLLSVSFLTSEARLFDPVLHAVYSVPMSSCWSNGTKTTTRRRTL